MSRGAGKFRAIGIVIAVLGLSGAVAGCKTNSAATAYAYDAHYQMVSDWCVRYGQGRTPALQEDCVRRAWEELPPTTCNRHPCTEQFNRPYGYVHRTQR